MAGPVPRLAMHIAGGQEHRPLRIREHGAERVVASVSRLPGEPKSGVEQVDFTPGAPRNLQGSVTLFF